MDYHETMRVVQSPDIYDGPSCDQHSPRWVGSADGDMDGDGPIGSTFKLAAKQFPPGTKVLVYEPECPMCGCVPSLLHRNGKDVWACECDFNWKEWAEAEFC